MAIGIHGFSALAAGIGLALQGSPSLAYSNPQKLGRHSSSRNLTRKDAPRHKKKGRAKLQKASRHKNRK